MCRNGKNNMHEYTGSVCERMYIHEKCTCTLHGVEVCCNTQVYFASMPWRALLKLGQELFTLSKLLGFASTLVNLHPDVYATYSYSCLI